MLLGRKWTFLLASFFFGKVDSFACLLRENEIFFGKKMSKIVDHFGHFGTMEGGVRKHPLAMGLSKETVDKNMCSSF